ncbi:MAG: BrnT family toxin [Leptolyngbyaceae cyanobacterium]
MDFEWDAVKAAINLAKRGISFHEASSVFDDPNSMTGYDPMHSDDEDRYLTAGIFNQVRLLIVWHTDRNNWVRLIGARKATKREREGYSYA